MPLTSPQSASLWPEVSLQTSEWDDPRGKNALFLDLFWNLDSPSVHWVTLCGLLLPGGRTTPICIPWGACWDLRSEIARMLHPPSSEPVYTLNKNHPDCAQGGEFLPVFSQTGKKSPHVELVTKSLTWIAEAPRQTVSPAYLPLTFCQALFSESRCWQSSQSYME